MEELFVCLQVCVARVGSDLLRRLELELWRVIASYDGGAGIEPRPFGEAASAPNCSDTSAALHGLYRTEEMKF